MLHKELPGKRGTVYYAAHNLNMDNPGEFNRSLEEFLHNPAGSRETS